MGTRLREGDDALRSDGGESLGLPDGADGALHRLCVEDPLWGREFARVFTETIERRRRCPRCGHRFSRPID